MTAPTQRTSFQEPSLVPMADMLTNTVGIMLFILIFTVLATGTATMFRRLPIAQETDKSPVFIVCAENRIYPSDLRALLRDVFLKDVDGMPIDKRVEHDEFIMRSQIWSTGGKLGGGVIFEPRPGAGERFTGIRSSRSRFGETLSKADPKEVFVFFFVLEDSIDAFVAARGLAVEQGFEVGWEPKTKGDPIGLMLFGVGGEGAKRQ